jgi:hypothetical protein
MTDLEQALIDRGLPADDVTYIADLVEASQAAIARAQAGQLLHLIFLRVGRDSAAGCALRRALGFSSDTSLARAAREFCVSKQYLHDLQTGLEAQLGPLRFGGAKPPAAGAPPPPGSTGPLAS